MASHSRAIRSQIRRLTGKPMLVASLADKVNGSAGASSGTRCIGLDKIPIAMLPSCVADAVIGCASPERGGHRAPSHLPHPELSRGQPE
jgi:hypothetical protein